MKSHNNLVLFFISAHSGLFFLVFSLWMCERVSLSVCMSIREAMLLLFLHSDVQLLVSWLDLLLLFAQALLLLSQCRAISSVVIAKQMIKKKKKRKENWEASNDVIQLFSTFQCFNISVVTKGRKIKCWYFQPMRFGSFFVLYVGFSCKDSKAESKEPFFREK